MNNDIQIIIKRINTLYPDLKIIDVQRQDEDYIVVMEKDVTRIGSEFKQRWTVQDGKAVFKEAFR